jgi:2-dehydropantoate 2-reductase
MTSVAVAGDTGIAAILAAKLSEAGRMVTLVHWREDCSYQADDRTEGKPSSAQNDQFRGYRRCRAADVEEPFDVVLLAVNRYEVARIALDCARIVGPNGILISLLNGLDAADDIVRGGYDGCVIHGIVDAALQYVSPNVVILLRNSVRIILWASSDFDSRYSMLYRVLGTPDIQVMIDNDGHQIWQQFVFTSTFSGVATLISGAAGLIKDNLDTLLIFRNGLCEGLECARARGIQLRPDTLEKMMNDFQNLPSKTHAAMQLDRLSNRPLELRWLSGRIVEEGYGSAVNTPVHGMMCAAISPYAGGFGLQEFVQS